MEAKGSFEVGGCWGCVGFDVVVLVARGGAEKSSNAAKRSADMFNKEDTSGMRTSTWSYENAMETPWSRDVGVAKGRRLANESFNVI